MRILITSHGYKPAYRMGGPIESVSAVAQGLVKRGHEVSVFTTNANLDEDLDVRTGVPIEVEGVSVIYFPRTSLRLPLRPSEFSGLGFLYAPGLFRQLNKDLPTFDLVHTQVPFIWPTLAAAIAAKRHKKPLFYHQRGVLSPERLKAKGLKKRAYLNLVEKTIIKSAAGLIALTEAEAADFRRLHPSGNIRVIPNGISPAEWNVAAPQQPGLPEIPDDSPVVLFLGRMHPVKGVVTLLDAFLAIRKLHPLAHLVFAGPSEAYSPELLLQRVAVADRPFVHFLGMVEGARKKQLLSRAQVFALPSQAEGFSMAVLEAMASRTAVLLSPGCRFDAVATGGAGYIARDSVSDTASGLNRLLSDPVKLHEMGLNARAMVESNFDWETIVDQVEDFYDQTLRAIRG